MAATFLVHITMGVLGRLVPQMNILLTSFPITISVGLIVLGLGLPFIACGLSTVSVGNGSRSLGTFTGIRAWLKIKTAEKNQNNPPRKNLADARRKGQVPLTRELPPLFVLLGGVGAFTLWAPQMLQQFSGHYRLWLEQAGTLQLDTTTLHLLLLNITNKPLCHSFRLGSLWQPLALAALLMQTGPLWIEEGLQPKPSKLNPKNGIKRLFSWKGVELIKSLLKVAMVGGILYGVLSEGMRHLVQFPIMGLS